MSRLVVRIAWAVLVFAVFGCEVVTDDYYFVCPDLDRSATSGLPATLSETGLYQDGSTHQLGDGVRPYRPRFELWSDGAEKRRWIWLPEGESIDSSDMDSWSFPVGTRLWKEFAVGTRRVETRLLIRSGRGENAGDWQAISYVWRDDGSDADATPTGFIDARGTDHDVPAASECVACHGGRASFVLGFSAVQLGDPGVQGSFDLASLSSEGRLSHPPPAGAMEVPGDERERATLGYLHANCSHCHNGDRPSAPCFSPELALSFFLEVDGLGSTGDTNTYRSAIGTVVRPGDPDGSRLDQRFRSRDIFYRMPPLGSERVDADARDLLRQWIEDLP